MPKRLIFYSILALAIFIWFPLNMKGLTIATYQYCYLGLAVLIWFLGYRFFGGRFVRPKWKQAGKLLFYLTVSWGFILWIGHYALIFILGHQLLGGIGHFVICKKHGIDWRTCQPEEKYLALTEKWAKGDFSRTNKE